MSELDALAAKFGIEIRNDEDATVLVRDGVSVRLVGTLGTESAAARHRTWCALFGVRLGADRLRAAYDFDDERPTAKAARNVYEVPSIYGERLHHLVPGAVADVAERVGGARLVRQPWSEDSGPEIILVRELARHFHVLAEIDLDHLPFDRENMLRYGRFALFYDAYNYRPRRVETQPWGRLKWFETRDGQAASRATLLPDFDYDAARAGGAFVLLDRDRFVIAEPTGRTEDAVEALGQLLRDQIEAAPLPFSRRVWLMTDAEVVPGPTIEGEADFDAADLVDAIEMVTNEDV